MPEQPPLNPISKLFGNITDALSNAPGVIATKEMGKIYVNSVLSAVETLGSIKFPELTEIQKETRKIADDLYKYIDDNHGAVGDAEFTRLLKKVTMENVIGVMERFEKKAGHSLIWMMVDETASDDKDVEVALLGGGDGKKTTRGVFVLLLDQARAVGVDDRTINSYYNQFKKEFDRICTERGGWPYIARDDADKLDEITKNVINLIKIHIQRIQENQTQKPSAPARQIQRKAVNGIVHRYNKALTDFNNQKQTEGWAAAVADIWGEYMSSNGNYEEAVRTDLKIARREIDELKFYLTKGEKEFNERFFHHFGVSFDPVAIENYEKQETRYIAASQAQQTEDAFKSQYSLLLNGKALAAETTSSTTTSVRGGTYSSLRVVQKEEVYKREFDKIAALFDGAIKNDKSGQYALLGITSGKIYVEKAIEAAGAKDKSIDEKYKVLQNIAQEISKKLTDERQLACGGSSLKKIEQEYQNAYKAAYGLENDILKRITEYNISQQKGAGIVKGATVAALAIGVGLLTAGTGSAAVAGAAGATSSFSTAAVTTLKGAGIVSGLTFLAETSDRLTSANGLTMQDLGVAVKASLISGGMCLVFGGQSYAITNLTVKAGLAAGMSQTAAGYTAAIANGAGIVGTGLGTEYLLTGEISAEGATFTVIMALTATGLQIMQVNKAASLANETPEARFNREFSNAKALLGISDDTQITEELLKQIQREQAKLYHPDGMFPADAAPELVQGATDLYQLRQEAIQFLDKVLKNPVQLTPQVQPALPKVTISKQGDNGQTLTASHPVNKPTVPTNTGGDVAANVPAPAGQGAQVVPLKPSPSIGAMAAAGSGSAAEISGTVAETAVQVNEEQTNSVTQTKDVQETAEITSLKEVSSLTETSRLQHFRKYMEEYFEYLNYTWQHKKAFLQIEREMLGHNTLQGYLHDTDKLFLYAIGVPHLQAHQWHKTHSSHHVIDGHVKDPVQAVIDWECARITKPDKPLSAVEYYQRFPYRIPEIEEVFEKYGYVPKGTFSSKPYEYELLDINSPLIQSTKTSVIAKPNSGTSFKGQKIEATEGVSGQVCILPVGTKLSTNNGETMIDPGEVIIVDENENSIYTLTFENFLSKYTEDPNNPASKELFKLLQEYIEKDANMGDVEKLEMHKKITEAFHMVNLSQTLY